MVSFGGQAPCHAPLRAVRHHHGPRARKRQTEPWKLRGVLNARADLACYREYSISNRRAQRFNAVLNENLGSVGCHYSRAACLHRGEKRTPSGPRHLGVVTFVHSTPKLYMCILIVHMHPCATQGFCRCKSTGGSPVSPQSCGAMVTLT